MSLVLRYVWGMSTTLMIPPFDLEPVPIGSTARLVVSLPVVGDQSVDLNAFGHMMRPDLDGQTGAQKLTLLKRGLAFVHVRGQYESREAFTADMGFGGPIPRYLSVRTSEGTVVAIGEIRAAEGTYNNRVIRAAAGAIRLLVNSH